SSQRPTEQQERPSDLPLEPTLTVIRKGRSAVAHHGHPSRISRSTHPSPLSLLLVSFFPTAITPAINSRSLLFIIGASDDIREARDHKPCPSVAQRRVTTLFHTHY
ncbi:MAG: hypothetical protein WA728_04270, partial [Xanthobacteraceae bacterium]